MNPPRAYRRTVGDQTWEALPGISLAGAVYGVGVVCVAMVWGFSQAHSFPNVVEGTVFLGFAFLVAVPMGFVYAGVLGLGTLSLVTLFNFSMQHVWKPMTAAAIAGGMAGYFPTCFVVFEMSGDWANASIALILGPLSAMILAQSFAVYRVRKCKWGLTSIDRLVVGRPPELVAEVVPWLDESKSHEPESEPLGVHPLDRVEDSSRVQRNRIAKLQPGQFTVWRMMVATGWIALLFAVICAFNAANIRTAIVLGSYVVCQVIALQLGRYVLPWMDRRLERQSFAIAKTQPLNAVAEADAIDLSDRET